MTIAKIVAPVAVVALLMSSSMRPASALMLPVVPTTPPPAATLGVGGGLAVGVIAMAALLCTYDVWLKINGVKNWDGTPKVVHVHHHH